MEENKLPYNNYVVPTRRMSASEIAEMVNSHSDRLLDVDFGFCTDWYRNVDFMEEVISKVNTTEDIDQLIRLMLLKQGLQTCCDHHPKVCYRVTDERKFAPYVEDLGQILHAVRCRVLHNRDMQREMDEFRRKWCSRCRGYVARQIRLN